LSNLISQDSGSRNRHSTGAPRYLQQFFLKRLHRFASIRLERGRLLDVAESDLRLLDKAIYSTFCDCLDLGAGDEARSILRHEFAGVEGTQAGENASN
jgi:hypothetical protein